MNTRVSIGVAALALALTMSTAVHAQDFPGEYHIVAAGKTNANGWMLATSKDQLIASNKIGGIRWKFQNAGKSDKGVSLYLIKEADNYLIVKDGKPVLVKQKPGANQGRWIVPAITADDHAILYYDDDQKGANALSLPESDGRPVEDPNLSNDLKMVYSTGLERHNAGGRGHDHQQWEIRKRE